MREKETEKANDATALVLVLRHIMPTDRAKDTADTLIRRFYDIAGVLDAEEDELASVCGKESAELLKEVRFLFERYVDRKTNVAGECYDNIEKLGRYLVGRYAAVECECVLLLLLDNSYRLICEETVCEGSVNSARISPKALCSLAKERGASAAVLSHNHPHGIALPSQDDVSTTASLSAIFESEGIPLLEHILVAGDEYTPIIYTKLGNKRTMPKSAYGEV